MIFLLSIPTNYEDSLTPSQGNRRTLIRHLRQRGHVSNYEIRQVFANPDNANRFINDLSRWAITIVEVHTGNSPNDEALDYYVLLNDRILERSHLFRREMTIERPAQVENPPERRPENPSPTPARPRPMRIENPFGEYPDFPSGSDRPRPMSREQSVRPSIDVLRNVPHVIIGTDGDIRLDADSPDPRAL
jgi:hypothetical protein